MRDFINWGFFMGSLLRASFGGLSIVRGVACYSEFCGCHVNRPFAVYSRNHLQG